MQDFSNGRRILQLNSLVAALTLLAIPSGVLAQTAEPYASTGLARSDIIPPDFRGQITYDGSMQGTATFQSRSSNHVGIGGFNVNIPNAQRVPIQSHYHAVITFDHSTIRGTVNVRGNVNAAGSFTGTREGDTCYTISDQDGRRSRSRCTMSMVALSEDYTNAQGQHIQTHTEATRTALVDFVERDRQQAAARAEQARKDAEFAAYLKSRPRASKAMAAALGQAITQDAAAWVSNRYDSGSLSDVVVLKTSTDGTKTLRGNYTYNGGSSGWVQAQVSGSSVQCLEYWDFAGTCNAVRTYAASTNPQTASSEKSDKFSTLRGSGLEWNSLSPSNNSSIKTNNDEDRACLLSASGDKETIESRTASAPLSETVTTDSKNSTLYIIKNICDRPISFLHRPNFLQGKDVTIGRAQAYKYFCVETTQRSVTDGIRNPFDSFFEPHSNTCYPGEMVKVNGG